MLDGASPGIRVPTLCLDSGPFPVVLHNIVLGLFARVDPFTKFGRTRTVSHEDVVDVELQGATMSASQRGTSPNSPND